MADTIVVSEKFSAANVKKERSAMPVMMPGSASGRINRNDTASRPKKRKRWTANAAIDASSSAIAVAISPARTDSHSAAAHLLVVEGRGEPLRRKPRKRPALHV